MSQTSHSPTLTELIKLSRNKVGFTDPAALMGGAGGGGGTPPGGDPMAAMGGGAPPADPAGGAAPPAGGDPLSAIMAKLDQLGAAGGAGGGGAPIKPKIDTNVELMQIKNMLAKICDALQIQIPAQDMVATPEKLMGMAQSQSAGGAAPPQSAIPPIDPVQAAAPMGAGGGVGGGAEKQSQIINDGEPFGAITTTGKNMVEMSGRAKAIALMMSGG